MAPGKQTRKIVRHIPGPSTGDDDEILIDDHGDAWKRVPTYEADATCWRTRGTLTNHGTIIF